LEEAIVLGDRVIVMSSRPGKIVLDQKVPFERPRSPELRAQSDFNEFKNELWLCLKGEVEHYLERVNSVEGKIGSNDEG
jgi:NitT/TauT family transport system ATP-binding protein